jgi:glycosyltransferase involved in cell wall biosynthesis
VIYLKSDEVIVKQKSEILEETVNFNQISKNDIQIFKISDIKKEFPPKYKQEYENYSNSTEEIESVAILPAFNLENTIEDIVKRTKCFVDEVIVISDGSNDNTNLKAKCAGAICPLHTNIMGKGYAIRKGIEHSRLLKPRYIILMDSDGQHLPEEIPRFLHILKNEKKDMVIGSRIKGILKTSLINRFGNKGLNILSFIMTGKWISDVESGYRAFIANKLYNLELNTNDYVIDCELLFKSIHGGLKIIEVPITVTKAIPGIKILDGVKVALYAIKNGFLMNLRRLRLHS